MILEIFQAISCFFALVGALGLLRLPGVYTRVHASTVSTVGGVVLFLATLAFQSTSPHASAKFVLLIFFILLTSPTASHIIANSAYHSRIHPRIHTLGFEEKK